MVDLQFFEPKDLPELNYELDEIQAQFSALPKQALERIEARNQNDDFFAIQLRFSMTKRWLAFVS